MGRMSDMHIDQQQEAADELLYEIDYWRDRAAAAERALGLISAVVADESGETARSFLRQHFNTERTTK